MPNALKMNWEKNCFEPVKYPELQRGQIIHSWSGMCGCYHEKSVLSSTTHDQWETHYRAIDMETHEYTYPHALHPMDERNSLGSFYKAGEVLPEDEVTKYERLALEF